MKHPNPLKAFGIILPAVAEMMDEQQLSKRDAMAALLRFLGSDEQPIEVRAAIRRLEAAEDDGEFRTMLREECVSALELKDSRR